MFQLGRNNEDLKLSNKSEKKGEKGGSEEMF